MSGTKVIKVLDDGLRLVINKGIEDKVYTGQTYLVFELGEELFDPDTTESLGELEIVKGKGKVIHVQDRISTIETIEREKRIYKSTPSAMVRAFTPLGGSSESTTEEILKPFLNPKVGDYAKFVR